MGDHATNRVNSIAYLKDGVSDGRIFYTYDNMGNISSISENGKQTTKYEYDALGRLIKELHIDKSLEILYTYDNNGNILTKSVNGEVVEYKYKENTDQRANFVSEYDAVGNPKDYREYECTWSNGKLTSLCDGDVLISYAYDGFGLRTSKQVGADATIYYTYDSNGNLIKEVGSKTIEYIYGTDGIIGIKVNNASYLFRKNLCGDVTHIYSTSGTLVGKYSYTAFGECTIEKDSNNIASLNPIRYRSYYYDTETNYYYLKSRYYDPELGRFISIDSIEYIDPETINGLNLYAYCGNNPERTGRSH